VVEYHPNIPQLRHLGVLVEISRVGLDLAAADAVLGDPVREPFEHLVGAVGGLHGGRRPSPGILAAEGGEQSGGHHQAPCREPPGRAVLPRQPHTAPARIRSWRCTAPTTAPTASRTGSAITP